MDVYAIDISDPKVNPAAQFGNLGIILNVVIPMITIVAALGFLAMLLFGAYTFLTAGGNAEKVGTAKKTLTWSIIGLVLIVTAYLIVKVVTSLLGVDNIPL